MSALLDGQLAVDDAERAWSHVYACHACRDLVEREGWVKTRLSRLSTGHDAGAPDRLKGALVGMTPGDVLRSLGHPVVPAARPRTARVAGLAALGGGAVGAAVVGVLALGTAPADAPITTNLQRPPVTQTVSPTPGPVDVSSRR